MKSDLRKALRKARRALSPTEHRLRSRRAGLHAMQAPGFGAGKRIAVYQPFDRETDTQFLIQAGTSRGALFYLPLITHRQRATMAFVPHTGTLRRGHFGIDVPAERAAALAPRWFDLIILPLVGVDACGHRLGMGAGFYDRALAFKSRAAAGFGPKLVGFAFDAQRVDDCFADSWDIRLDYLATESGLHRFS